jgi:hypothetical protein
MDAMAHISLHNAGVVTIHPWDPWDPWEVGWTDRLGWVGSWVHPAWGTRVCDSGPLG